MLLTCARHVCQFRFVATTAATPAARRGEKVVKFMCMSETWRIIIYLSTNDSAANIECSSHRQSKQIINKCHRSFGIYAVICEFLFANLFCRNSVYFFLIAISVFSLVSLVLRLQFSVVVFLWFVAIGRKVNARKHTHTQILADGFIRFSSYSLKRMLTTTKFILR